MKAEEFLSSHGFTRQVVTTNGVSYDRLCSWMEQYASEERKEAVEDYAKYRDDDNSEQWIKMYNSTRDLTKPQSDE